MAASQFLTLLHASSRSSIPKPTSPFFYNPIKKFGEMSKGRLVEERAPSTAEEFERVAEEKAKEAAKQGVASQTTDKTFDGAGEAAMGDSKVGSVKNRHKEHESQADYRRKGD
ncbi:uncharacterized protein G2W53_029840 [Senna tora]|uniref:Uncharacterized protein n=1 Tax=Senna tora TaxID=362788 RepID=A0A834WE28_9FABA|nr:uncharacterized protein G2W53_029840 [Senna tora]